MSIEEKVDFLEGQVVALTQICMMLISTHPNRELIRTVEKMIADAPRNMALSAASIQGTQVILNSLRTVLQLSEPTQKPPSPKPPKNH
jgi:hypothetical protein